MLNMGANVVAQGRKTQSCYLKFELMTSIDELPNIKFESRLGHSALVEVG